MREQVEETRDEQITKVFLVSKLKTSKQVQKNVGSKYCITTTSPHRAENGFDRDVKTLVEIYHSAVKGKQQITIQLENYNLGRC